MKYLTTEYLTELREVMVEAVFRSPKMTLKGRWYCAGVLFKASVELMRRPA
jgi:hypothetical protein